MKSLRLEAPPGGPKKGSRNIVAVRDVSIPEVGPGMVLVKILAAAFNRRDEWSALGLYPGLVYENSTLGCDACGVVVDPATLQPVDGSLQLLVPSRGWDSDPAGPEADLPGSTFRNEFGGTGFAILGATRGVRGAGTFTEYIAVKSDQLVRAPAHLDAVQASALPCAALTAYRALFTKGQVQKGQNVLVTGIGGGVALYALQLALAAGARVFVTGGSDQKIKRAIDLGASGGALYRDAEWTRKIKEQLPAERPWLDCVVDSAGGDICAHSLRAGLRGGGRVVVLGATTAKPFSFTMREVLQNVDLMGTTLGSAAEFSKCVRFVEEHKIVPIVDTVLDGLDDALRGFELMANSEKRGGGKVVVRIADAASTNARV
ncbi:propionate--CoA ligase [Malassezia cuniculi]|uniref:Propionate--CoA ligase n=1 Tax=Malassezia cuniculi TaxID=948313 RepID=A0AAF0J6W0_9BASI|nr:propionate--CoA ligase [Malassezia cuniculi]